MRQCFFYITNNRGGILKIEEAIKLLNGKSFDNKLTELYVAQNRVPYEKNGI
ncbi:hypothetical protein JCM35486_19900 [Blautia wexlerae]